MMKDKDEFLRKYRITEEQFKKADISWDVLTRIYEDYYNNKRIEERQVVLKNLKKKFNEKHKEWGMHSFYGRIKDGEHLIAKIIRKRNENYSKYRDIDETNYYKIVRDLVGFRGLIVFKEEWINVHEHIISTFPDRQDNYVGEEYDKIDTVPDCCIVEAPVAHIRDGDNKKMYMDLLGEENIYKKQNYRSVHYIIKYQGMCFELQVRTLFEDALEEMDHRLRYPLYAKNEKLNQYSAIMNHLVGTVDELGSFYYGLYQEVKAQDSDKMVVDQKDNGVSEHENKKTDEPYDMRTPEKCLNNTINK